MKRIGLLWLMAFSLTAGAQDLPKGEFNISAGYLFEGEAYLAYYDSYSSVGETFHLRIDYTGYFGDHFGMGGYVSYFNPYYVAETVSAFELGFVVKPRFPAGENMVVKIPIYVGYRSYGGDYGQGLAIDLSGQLQLNLDKVRPFVELGILSQPIGGNEATDVTFSPTFLFAIGLSL